MVFYSVFNFDRSLRNVTASTASFAYRSAPNLRTRSLLRDAPPAMIGTFSPFAFKAFATASIPGAVVGGGRFRRRLSRAGVSAYNAALLPPLDSEPPRGSRP